MTWVQKINPLHNLALSALIAFIPIAFIFWALIIRKLKSYHSSILTLLLAIVLAVVVSGMPISLVLASALHGALYGLFPICWIILGAVFLYNITVASGQFEIIKNVMSTITPDRRL
jgi:lactate permease